MICVGNRFLPGTAASASFVASVLLRHNIKVIENAVGKKTRSSSHSTCLEQPATIFFSQSAFSGLPFYWHFVCSASVHYQVSVEHSFQCQFLSGPLHEKVPKRNFCSIF
jgi:hypothetical protein